MLHRMPLSSLTKGRQGFVGAGWLGGLLLLGLGAGCSETPPDQSIAQPLSYRHDAQPLLDRYCNSCHTAGGIGPFALQDYASVQRYAPLIKSAVESNRMPPWMPSDASLPLNYSRKMRPEDKDALLRWLAEGMVEGDPSVTARTDIPAAETVAPPRADLTLDFGQDYTPVTQRPDDYHCFVFDPKLTADTYMVAGTVVPGNRSIVHHALLFEIPETDAAAIQAKNVNNQGYTCYGGPGTPGRPVTLLGWVPGGVPMRTPAGTALRLHKGSLLVMQLHYNTSVVKDGKDRTQAQIELTTTPPQHELYVMPLAQPKGLKLAAGDAGARQDVSFPLSLITGLFGLPIGDYKMYSAAPHMHTLGKRVTVSVSGKLVVELPKWDFHWQQTYGLKDPLVLKASDLMQLTCEYDNSAANQPVIDGVQQPPKDVAWGEGTADEMCLNYFAISPLN